MKCQDTESDWDLRVKTHHNLWAFCDHKFWSLVTLTLRIARKTLQRSKTWGIMTFDEQNTVSWSAKAEADPGLEWNGVPAVARSERQMHSVLALEMSAWPSQAWTFACPKSWFEALPTASVLTHLLSRSTPPFLYPAPTLTTSPFLELSNCQCRAPPKYAGSETAGLNHNKNCTSPLSLRVTSGQYAVLSILLTSSFLSSHTSSPQAFTSPQCPQYIY